MSSSNITTFLSSAANYTTEPNSDDQLDFEDFLILPDHHHHHPGTHEETAADISCFKPSPTLSPVNGTSSSSFWGWDWEVPSNSPCAADYTASIGDNEGCVKTTMEKEEEEEEEKLKIAFRTRSCIEVMDDGFKWIKYGKKMIKNNLNPRHYYRCSTEGCKVKKRIERQSEDEDFVITTYEGKHNHQTPSAPTLPPAAAAAPLHILMP